jgi:uncharacterized protein YkvS
VTSFLTSTSLQIRTKAPSVGNAIRFKTGLRNTVLDVMKDRGWKETDRYSF